MQEQDLRIEYKISEPEIIEKKKAFFFKKRILSGLFNLLSMAILTFLFIYIIPFMVYTFIFNNFSKQALSITLTCIIFAFLIYIISKMKKSKKEQRR